MRADLVQLGYWRSAVTAAEAYDPSAGIMGLVFQVDPGPLVDLEVRGFGDTRVKGRIRDLLKEGGLKSDVLEEASDLLEEDARRQGHRLAHVTRHEEQRGPRLVLVYDVEAGPRASVASVKVEGEGTEGLETALKTRPLEPLVDATVAEDVRALTRALEERGYPAARVDAEVPDGGGDLPVVFRARPGPGTRVTSFRVESPQPLPVGERAPGAPAARGRALPRDRPRARPDTVLSAYRNSGYLQADVIRR
jgi:outer membrane protein assembly factor BamA